ncbi:MAG: glycoside hydrolase family 3 C-terminal domain-containing protein [bacterium]|nr:glycoside hydrolase family 3 C-terminal domain-containing protein [bacterium]
MINNEQRKQARKQARELVAQMSLEEKASQLKYNAPAIKRLGVPAYNWWNEALHGVARAGTATMFPQAIAMAAVFDDVLLKETADVISTEARAKYNAFVSENDRGIYKGLTVWSPNVNIFRDPRWGRGHETYGEDPYLTSRLGVAFIEGLQGDGEHLKTAACVKHFAVHSGPEAVRHEFNAEASKKDMWETYLPAFEACVKEANVEAVMGAYNRVNGEVCCGSKTLIQDILRGDWKFEGHFVSDCWAIRDFHEHHMVTKTPTESAALALKTGCDMNCGNTYLHIVKAYQEGLITEEDITRAAERLFTTRYLLGMFGSSEYDQIPYEEVENKAHRELAVQMAEKSIVLLKNEGALPIQKEQIEKIAVIGPNANSRSALIGNYHGTSSHYVTVLRGIQDAVGEEILVHYAQGSHLSRNREEVLADPDDRLAEAVVITKESDIAVVCLGLDETLEGEEGDEGNAYVSGDKNDLELPESQQRLLEGLAEIGKPIILVVMTGSAVNLGFAKKHPNVKAILQAWYPGAEGGRAVADILFGKVSPSGKLPVTFYESLDGLPAFEDYAMKGRTYRYMECPAQYPFGYGLTYSKVTLSNVKVHIPEEVKIGQPVCVIKQLNADVSIDISNIGDYDTDEVIELYIKNHESEYAVKNHSLCGFKRVHLSKDETQTVQLQISCGMFLSVNDEGKSILDSSLFTLYAGVSQPDEVSVKLSGVEPAAIQINLYSKTL